jgi:protein SCO1/2
MRRKRGRRSALQRVFMFSIAVIAIAGGYFWGSQHAPKSSFKLLRQLEQPAAIEPFTLQDHSGAPFTRQELLKRWSLCLFGYTGDSEGAGTIMTLAVRIHNRLAATPELQQQVQILFVTLDPEHDTEEKLKGFISHYGGGFLALTGAEQEIERLARQLGIRYRVEQREDGSHSIIHGTSIGLINPEGTLAGLFTGLVDAGSIAADIQLLAGFQE